LVCDNFDIQRDLVLNTDCIWVASRHLVREHIAEGRLVRLKAADLNPARADIALVWRRGRTLSPSLLAIAAHVRSICNAYGLPEPEGHHA